MTEGEEGGGQLAYAQTCICWNICSAYAQTHSLCFLEFSALDSLTVLSLAVDQFHFPHPNKQSTLSEGEWRACGCRTEEVVKKRDADQ